MTPGSFPSRELPREQRRRLTACLLRQAAQAEDDELRAHLLEEVVLANICVARSIASRYRSRGVASEDLEQVANAALVRAVNQFDGDRASDFLSFAVPSIRGELRRYFRDHGWVVRPPRRVQELQSEVIEERDRHQAGERRTPTDAQIAERLGVPEADVTEALRAEGCFTPSSLDAQLSEQGGATVGESLADSHSGEDSDAAEARVMLQPVVRQLSSRDRELLRLRFFEELTQQEIANEFGVTQTQVSRLLSRVLRDLRCSLEEGQGTPI
ncbi:sigma-70 family RNA polymerase sigma factor [Nocardioides sp. JQ2195]|uniref:sigma-70 family RNA polymerase sigma factor n=1 Tax=Nocardioides sp. JQ2195 TaxID=2592334 RepID=UPI00143E93BB|nr:sigma-70 family RNA polymerase sigma factor [Nocardioides sp. JQ2195]QIX27568.1 sigma-70 family RNA polymerase sigma factor [Nocardioides sp. JQ2195]